MQRRNAVTLADRGEYVGDEEADGLSPLTLIGYVIGAQPGFASSDRPQGSPCCLSCETM
jgi:hypothetical protein